jgi:uncharacterized DUF497 family protein
MEFDWDEANREHIAAHNLRPDEVEYAMRNVALDVDFEIREGEERVIQVGATARGRIITIVSTLREHKVRVVTAFDASRRRRREYEDWRRTNYGTTH